MRKKSSKPPRRPKKAARTRNWPTRTSQSAEVKIDLTGLDQRILALPLPQRNYGGLQAGREGILYLLEGPAAVITVRGFTPKATLNRFDLETRKSEPLVNNVSGAIISADGDKLLYRQAAKWYLVASDKAVKPGEGSLNLDDMEVRVRAAHRMEGDVPRSLAHRARFPLRPWLPWCRPDRVRKSVSALSGPSGQPARPQLSLSGNAQRSIARPCLRDRRRHA